MVDVLNYSVIAPARKPGKSYDFAILVSVGLLIAAGLIIAISASASSTEINPINPDLVIAYP